MFQLTIRELLLVAALAGVCVGWSIERVNGCRQLQDYQNFALVQIDHLKSLGFEFDPDNRTHTAQPGQVWYDVPDEFVDRIGGMVAGAVPDYLYRHATSKASSRGKQKEYLDPPILCAAACAFTAVVFFWLGRSGRQKLVWQQMKPGGVD